MVQRHSFDFKVPRGVVCIMWVTRRNLPPSSAFRFRFHKVTALPHFNLTSKQTLKLSNSFCSLRRYHRFTANVEDFFKVFFFLFVCLFVFCAKLMLTRLLCRKIRCESKFTNLSKLCLKLQSCLLLFCEHQYFCKGHVFLSTSKFNNVVFQATVHWNHLNSASLV